MTPGPAELMMIVLIGLFYAAVIGAVGYVILILRRIEVNTQRSAALMEKLLETLGGNDAL